MPKYAWDIKNLLFEEDVKAMFDKGDTYERLLVSILWTTAPRTSEAIELVRENVTYNINTVSITLKTLKLGKSKAFAIDHRTLTFKRPGMADSNMYLESIINQVRTLPPEGRLLPFTRRWADLVTNRLGMKAIGRPIAPYHFRHSVLSHMAREGASIDQLKHFKGAKDIDSIVMYLHARPYIVEMELQRRNRNQDTTPHTSTIPTSPIPQNESTGQG
jgi:site-specific recombinase XerD